MSEEEPEKEYIALEPAQSETLRRRMRTVVPVASFAATTALYADCARPSNNLVSTQVACGVLLACAHTFLASRFGIRDARSYAMAISAGALLGYHALGRSLYGLYAIFQDLLVFVARSAPGIRAGVVLVVGLALFFVRRHLRAVYGLGEIAV